MRPLENRSIIIAVGALGGVFLDNIGFRRLGGKPSHLDDLGAGKPRQHLLHTRVGGTLQLTIVIQGTVNGTSLGDFGYRLHAPVPALAAFASALTYFDVNDVAIPAVSLAGNLGNIRRLVVTLTAQSAGNQEQRTFSLTSSVRPRNL